MLPRAHARRDLSSQRRLIHRAGAAVGSFRVQLVVSAEVRSHVRSVPPPNRKNPATVLNAPELRGSVPPHQHKRKTRAPVQSDLIVHFEQPTASPFFPGIRPPTLTPIPSSYDTTGRRYLDGSAGAAALSIGHDNP